MLTILIMNKDNYEYDMITTIITITIMEIRLNPTCLDIQDLWGDSYNNNMITTMKSITIIIIRLNPTCLDIQDLWGENNNNDDTIDNDDN